MAQKISQGNVFGRIGQHFGNTLAEQFPKELERGRLASGLRQLEQEKNLSPMQFYTRAISLPGVTPQMVESLATLAKEQNIRQAYQGIGRKGEQRPAQEVRRPEQPRNDEFAAQNAPNIKNENVPPQTIEGAEKNPLREEAIPRTPWDFKRKIQAMNENWEDNPGLTREENERLVTDQESRELARPAAEQAIDTYQKAQRQELQTAINDKLALKLQKDKEGLFQDLTGEYLDNLYRGAERDLRTSKNKNVEDIAHKWSEKGLNLAKTKTELDRQKADENIFSVIANKNEYRNKLKEAQKIFAEANNLEEFHKILQNDFNLSNQGSASIAYPLTPEVKKIIDSTKFKPNVHDSREKAIQIEKAIRPQDSLQAIAWHLRQKDPFFNQNEFFDQLREDRDFLGLTETQSRELRRIERELVQGSSKILPTWADIAYLPFLRT